MSSGRFVVLVGPDGVGKTTLARALLASWPGAGWYFHFCPPLVGGFERLPEPERSSPPSKAPKEGSRLAGWARLGRNVFRFWLAYFIRIRPAVARGDLVVGDRWSYGYVGQPHGLRFYGPEWLARIAVGLFPAPDVVLALSAPVSVIRSRKAELEEWEIEAELLRWGSLRGPRKVVLDATAPSGQMAATVIEGLLS